MMSNERPVKELDCANIAKEWRAWKHEFLMYMRASGKTNGTESTKIATFLWLIGRQASEIYNTLFPNDGTEERILGIAADNGEQGQDDAVAANNGRKLEDVLKAFDGYCIPKKNITMESFKFNNIVQKEKQPFVEFATELRKQIEFCSSQTYEAAKENKVMLNTNTQSYVNSVAEQQPKETINAVTRRACYNCGNDFTANHMESCKAKNINCRSCGRKGHFQRFCKSKGKQTDNHGSKPENNVGNRKLDNNNNNHNGKQQQQHSIDWGNSGNFVQIIDGSANREIKVNRIYRINSNKVANHTKRWYKEYQVGKSIG